MERARPEILAPAGDEDCLRAAVAAGADAVYFGLQSWSARARAKNFDDGALERALDYLHRHGRRGYVAINTLVFDDELEDVERAVRACANAGADAIIVQDLGVARLARAIAPDLPIHASTQMTCTDAQGVELAREIGASRVILARELSLDDIAAIRAETDVEVEVFVHGALCIAYSGQCLTSEAIGGRSANRGACAQACRLPYDLIVDGELRDTGDRAFLLSPEDLEASELVPRLAALGVSSLKIEGRLKGPAYVAGTVSLYRAAVDALDDRIIAPLRDRALATFTRGSGTGFLNGIDHQRLVEGVGCDHRGALLGVAREIVREGGKAWIGIQSNRAIEAGHGILVEGAKGGSGEIGGRVWLVRGALPNQQVWLGPERRVDGDVSGRRVFLSDDPGAEKAALAIAERSPARIALDLKLRARPGELAELEGTTADGRHAVVHSSDPIERARSGATSLDVAREKLGRLGDSPFELGDLTVAFEGDPMVSPGMLNRMRRALVDALLASRVAWSTADAGAIDRIKRASLPDRAPPLGGLFVLCRSLEQARAARDAGADGVWLDFLELAGTGAALRALRADGRGFVGVAPPRIRKPREEKIDAYLEGLEPDAILVRGLGALREATNATSNIARVGDFSLNATNRLTAHELLSRGLSAFTPAFDLDAAQLITLLRSGLGPYAEVVVHHPMALFHMEHCVFARELSSGHDHRDCGRPCERHALSLRDRAGMEHPVIADVGCRNTVFHASSQSAAALVPALRDASVRRFRIELVREDAAETKKTVRAYRDLLDGRATGADVYRALKTESTYGVVRGSLRVIDSAR